MVSSLLQRAGGAENQYIGDHELRFWSFLFLFLK